MACLVFGNYLRFGVRIYPVETNAPVRIVYSFFYFFVKSDIDGIRHSKPLSFYPNYKSKGGADDVAKNIKVGFKRNGSELSFSFPEGYDKNSELIIDPFVTATNSLTGVNAGIAKDIDFDYDGNIYVTGGGSTVLNMLAKFSSTGNLLCTFSGTLFSPAWT